MVIKRKVMARKNQLLVAIPAEVRELLRASPGLDVYWHITRRQEALLSTRPGRVAGRAFDPDLSNALERANAEIRQLRGKLQQRPLKVLHEGYAQGYLKHMGELIRLTNAFDRQAEALRALRQDVLASVLLPSRRARARGHPSPPPAPSTSEAEGGADTSGAQPPGVPVEDESRTDRAGGEPGA